MELLKINSIQMSRLVCSDEKSSQGTNIWKRRCRQLAASQRLLVFVRFLCICCCRCCCCCCCCCGQSPDKWWRRPSDHLQPIILHTSPRPQGQMASSFIMEDIGRKTIVPHFAKTIKVFPCFRSRNKYLTSNLWSSMSVAMTTGGGNTVLVVGS